MTIHSLDTTTTEKLMEPSLDDWDLFNTWFENTFSRQIITSEPKSIKNQQLLNESNVNGLTPLHLAAVEGNIAAIKVLLYLGANSSIENMFGALVVPVMHTQELISNKIKVFQLLLNQAPLETIAHQDAHGNTLLHKMASHDEFAELMSNFLKTYPQLANIRNKKHHYPVHIAVLNNQSALAKLLLQIDGAEKLANREGQTALHFASIYGDEEMINVCGAAAKDINILDKRNRTPLMFLSEGGRLNEVKNLIAHGADVNLSDRDGYTVLHYAAQSHNLDLVRWLIDEQKSDINQENRFHKRPIDLVNKKNNEDLYNFLSERGTCPAGSSPGYF